MTILAETTYFRNSFVFILSNSGSVTIKFLNQPFLNENNKKATASTKINVNVYVLNVIY